MLLFQKPPSEDDEVENSGGGGFSERSPSPGPPPEERLGLGSSLPPDYLPLRLAHPPFHLVKVTAADRAAAPCLR